MSTTKANIYLSFSLLRLLNKTRSFIYNGLRVYILQILMDSICIETEMKNVLRYLTKHIVMMAMMIIVVVDVVRRFREMAVVIDERQHYTEKTKQTLHKM